MEYTSFFQFWFRSKGNIALVLILIALIIIGIVLEFTQPYGMNYIISIVGLIVLLFDAIRTYIQYKKHQKRFR